VPNSALITVCNKLHIAQHSSSAYFKICFYKFFQHSGFSIFDIYWKSAPICPSHWKVSPFSRWLLFLRSRLQPGALQGSAAVPWPPVAPPLLHEFCRDRRPAALPTAAAVAAFGRRFSDAVLEPPPPVTLVVEEPRASLRILSSYSRIFSRISPSSLDIGVNLLWYFFFLDFVTRWIHFTSLAYAVSLAVLRYELLIYTLILVIWDNMDNNLG